jgi:hypothetical protein
MYRVIGASAKAGLTIGVVSIALTARTENRRRLGDFFTGPPFQDVEVSHSHRVRAVGEQPEDGKELVRISLEISAKWALDLHSGVESANNSG